MATHNRTPLPPMVIAMACRHAAAKGVLRGRPEAIMERMESFGADLLPGGWAFPALFSADPGDGSVPDLWEIGARFWSGSGASREARRLEGSFYTPPNVVDRVLDLLWGDAGPAVGSGKRALTVCDPALGCGFFFLRLVERLLAREKPQAVRAWAAASLYGVDMDASAVFMARLLLWLLLSDDRTEFLPDPSHFRCGDSLLGPAFGQAAAASSAADAVDWAQAFPDVAAAGGFGAVIGNPPYEVLTNFSRRPERKALVLAIRDSGYYRDSLRGQVNLYRCFIERALALVRPGGDLAFLVPLSLARDGAASDLRRRLLVDEAATEWVLYGERERIFPGVSQSFCVFKARRTGGRARSLTVWADGGRYSMQLDELEACAGETLAIPGLNGDALELWRWLWRCSGRLTDIAEMRVGEVDQTFYRDCMADDDTGCLLARGCHLSAFLLDVLPTPGRERFLRLNKFLAKKGAAADSCREHASGWRVAQLGIRNMHSRPRLLAALAPPGVYLGNSLNVYRPKAGTSLGFLAGVLNSALLDWLFRLSSGNNNINLHEMRRLPFPSVPSATRMGEVEKAYQACADSAGKDGNGLAAARIALDDAVARCYELPEELMVRWRGIIGS